MQVNDLHIHELWWDTTGWHHNDLSAGTGAPPATPNRNSPGYIFPSQGTQHVNYVGLDNHIHELWWNSAGWHHNDLTDCYGMPGFRTVNQSDIRSPALSMCFLSEWTTTFMNSGGIIMAGITMTCPFRQDAPQTNDQQPYGFAFESRGTKHVVYRDFKKNLIELYTS